MPSDGSLSLLVTWCPIALIYSFRLKAPRVTRPGGYLRNGTKGCCIGQATSRARTYATAGNMGGYRLAVAQHANPNLSHGRRLGEAWCSGTLGSRPRHVRRRPTAHKWIMATTSCRAQPGDWRWALSYLVRISVWMRPRELTSRPWSLAHCRIAPVLFTAGRPGAPFRRLLDVCFRPAAA